MPIQHADVINNRDIRAERAKAIYDTDKVNKMRKSHDNPAVKELYKDFLGTPNSHKAHEILHTAYTQRPKY